jgi:hypothetical protein
MVKISTLETTLLKNLSITKIRQSERMVIQLMRLRFLLVFSLLISTSCYAASGTQIDFLITGVKNFSGAALAGGKVYSYYAGTSSPRPLYTNSTLTTASPNPATLDAYGRAVLYGNGRYKIIIKDASGTTILTGDNLSYGDGAPFDVANIFTSEQTLSATATQITSPYPFTVGSNTIQFFINGIKQRKSEYTETSAYNLSFAAIGFSTSVELVVFSNPTVSIDVVEVTSTAGQTVFSVAPKSYSTGKNRIQAYRNGVKQAISQVSETATQSVTVGAGVLAGEEWEFIIFSGG